MAQFGPVIVSVVFWGTTYWPIEIANDYVPPNMVADLRTTLSALVLIMALSMVRARLPRGRLLLWAIGTGLVMIGLFQWGLIQSVDLAGPGNAAILVNLAPLIVLALGALLLAERVTVMRVSGLLIGFGGVVLMVAAQVTTTGDAGRLIAGVGAGLLAAVAWSIGTIAIRRIARSDPGMDMRGFMSVQYVIGALVLLPAGAVAVAQDGAEWSSAELWAAAVWIGPVSAMGVLLFFVALKQLSATRASAFLFLVPATAVVVEIARGNVPNGLVLAGMLLAILGVAIVSARADRFSFRALLPSPFRSR